MGELCRTYGVAALYVTHDLAVIANIADRVAVMYAGQIAELGQRDEIFAHPSHPYTRALLDSIPHMSQARALSGIPGRTPAPGARPSGCRFNDRCEFAIDECRHGVPELREVHPTTRCAASGRATSARWDISRGTVPDTDPDKPRDVILSIDDLGVFYGHKQVVFDVTFDVGKAEVVALVGESGSGKTTISRCVGGLHKEWTGGIAFEGTSSGTGSRKRSAVDRKRIQYIFQNPYLSLNPRLTIEQIVKRPMELFGIASGKAATERVVDLLDQVALGPGHAEVPSQSALRRRAPARRDRPRARGRARRAGLRRDHLGARRVGAGLDRRPARVAAGVARHQHALRHAQPGPRALDRRPRADPERRPASSRPAPSSR